ncbi:hypothetical protein [Arcanobacterium hippocoleae]|uniref:Vacuolar-type H+-ATPase subunit H n=1 Tax=Arcanobacterium hippocoleae TaxID=149017 RepID=A0ABU1T5G7_9ACTO|nr:hypothetical protein [Arcanobacterium hippocoleae]MDR6940126.1 vacuolar-type H+-ATPase subunit H [Arcanobacterium hippocoleae]
MSEYENYDEVETGESLIAVLEEITSLVDHAKSVPLSSSILINRHEMLDLLDRAAQMLPSQLVEAHQMLQHKAKVSGQARDEADRLIAEAREQAKHILAQAKAEAQRLASRDSVTIKARQQAAKIVDEAKSKASRVTDGANQYSDSTLAEVSGQLAGVQEYLAQIQVQIEAGRDVLAQRLDEYSLQQQDGESVEQEFEFGNGPEISAADLPRSSSSHLAPVNAADALGSASLDPVANPEDKLEFGGTEMDFAAVKEQFAHPVTPQEGVAQLPHGGEVALGEHDQWGRSDTELTAETAAMPEVGNHHANSLQQQARPAGSLPLQDPQSELPARLPEDFDEFVPELEFEQELDDFRAEKF